MPNQDISAISKFADATLALIAGASAEQSEDRINQLIEQWDANLTQTISGIGASPKIQLLKQQFGLENQSIAFLLLSLLPALDTKYTNFYREISAEPKDDTPTVDLVSTIVSSTFDDKTKLNTSLRDDSPVFYWRMLRRSGDDFIRSQVLPGKDIVLHLSGENVLDQDSTGLIKRSSKEELSLPTDSVKEPPTGQIVTINGGIAVRRRSYAFHCGQLLKRPVYLLNVKLLQTLDNPTDELSEALLFTQLNDGILYWEGGLSTLQAQADLVAVINAWLKLKGSCLLIGEDQHQTLPQALNSIKTDSIQLEKENPKINQMIWESVGNRFLGVTNVDYKQLSQTYTTDYVRIEETIRKAGEARQNTTDAVQTKQLVSYYLATSPEQITGFAQRDHAKSSFEDMVLPSEVQASVALIEKAYDQRSKLNPDKPAGVMAIFEGETGTGKTMTSVCFANQLGVPLYKVDYSLLVSTPKDPQKTLDQLFDEAERNTALLLFDNADSLFNQSSATAEHRALISALINKMEAYGNLIILATSAKPEVNKELFQKAMISVNFPTLNAKQQYDLFVKILAKKGVKLKNEAQLQQLVKQLGANGRQIENIVNNAILSASAGHVPLEELEIAGKDLAQAIEIEKSKNSKRN